MSSSELPPPPTRLRPGNVPLSSLVLPETFTESVHPDEAIKQAARQPHTWTRCPGAAFNVRRGPNYKDKRKKAPSASSLYEVFAVDVHSSETKLAHIGRVAALPPDPAPPPRASLPPYVIINWMVPNYPPSGLIGPKRSNGPGWNLVLYCRLSDAVRSQLAHAASGDGSATGGAATSAAGRPASVDLLRRFMHPVDGARLRGERLKCIMGLADTERPSFGMVLKQMILRYNFKPFLSKTASFCYVGPDYFEIDIDIHTWGHAALSAFNTVKEKMAALLPRVAVVVEADGDDEMPEQASAPLNSRLPPSRVARCLLSSAPALTSCPLVAQVIAGVFLTNLDPARAAPINAELAAYLSDAANHTPPFARTKSRLPIRRPSGEEGATPVASPVIGPSDGEEFDASGSELTPPSRSPLPERELQGAAKQRAQVCAASEPAEVQ